MPLEEYRSKRDFSQTAEPSGAPAQQDHDASEPVRRETLRFVVQEHHARALHWDFRLELDGVLLSWAVPKGPSLDPADKRLAVHVEDHPLDYADFEGTIPAGEYGAGTVKTWDQGAWEPLGDPRAGMAKGDFKFVLHGEKLRGQWVLVRLKPRAGEKRDNWLLIKERDEFARPHDAESAARATPADAAPEPAVPAPASPSASNPPPAPLGPALTVPLSDTIELELATLVDTAPSGPDWLAEVKYDGYRVAIVLADGHARALTRSGADWSDRFGPLVKAAEKLPASSAVLDGEAVVFDSDGISRFGLLQRALGQHPESISYAAFDLLYLNGYDLRDQPLKKRKDLLRELLAGEDGSRLRFADHVAGGADEFYRSACGLDLEGVVCKRANSPYTPGRGRDWVKVKCRQSQEFVVGGFTEGAGSRAALGSILVGTQEGDRLVYAGRIGTGFSEGDVDSLRAQLGAIERPSSPFDLAPHITGHVIHWTEPSMVVQAAFREWTAEGLLRQPIFLGLRTDKPAAEVVRESPAVTPKTRVVGPSTVRGVPISNADKTLFPDSPDFSKLDLAHYYEAVAVPMLAEVANRPLTLLRCPVGHGHQCFYQRHPDAGLPRQVRRFRHSIKHDELDFLYIDSVEGLVALAQMGVDEIHTWLSRVDTPRNPDRICFDLDPGPEVHWAQICSAASLVREECEGLGFQAFLKSTGSKGLHVVLPIEPVWAFDRVRALAKGIVDRLVARNPNMLVGKMAKDARSGRVFFDYLRNAEGASAVAPYSTRMRPGPTCAVPLDWDELTDDLDIGAFTPAETLKRLSSGINPWRTIGDAPAGATVLGSAESTLG